MKDSNFDIKLKEHYKLYILIKDQIIFESELLNNDIKFYSDINEQPSLNGGIRYFLLDSDMSKVDDIIKKNEIVANTESILVYDFEEGKKIFKLKALFYVIVIVYLF